MANIFQKYYLDISRQYEITNHVLTFGLDILWRRKAAREAVRHETTSALDVCSGTGELAFEILRRTPQGTVVAASDFTLSMFKEAVRKKGSEKILWTLGEAGSLPFRDGTFDIVTLAFATRNINTSRRALTQRFEEIRRILKPGGIYINLETSQPANPVFRRLYHLYAKVIIPPVGGILSGSFQAFRYLGASITRFYTSENLSGILKEAGFAQVSFKKLFWGAAAIHTAAK